MNKWKKVINKQTNEWMNKWMNEQMDECNEYLVQSPKDTAWPWPSCCRSWLHHCCQPQQMVDVARNIKQLHLTILCHNLNNGPSPNISMTYHSLIWGPLYSYLNDCGADLAAYNKYITFSERLKALKWSRIKCQVVSSKCGPSTMYSKCGPSTMHSKCGPSTMHLKCGPSTTH